MHLLQRISHLAANNPQEIKTAEELPSSSSQWLRITKTRVNGLCAMPYMPLKKGLEVSGRNLRRVCVFLSAKM